MSLWEPRPVTAPPPRWWGTLALGAVIMLGCLGPMVYSPVGWAISSRASFQAALVELAAWAVALALAICLRYRSRTFGVLLPAALLPLILPLGPVPALVCLGVALSRWTGPGTWASVATLACSGALVTVRDAVANPVGASWAKYLRLGSTAHPEIEAMDAPAHVGTAVAWYVVGLCLAVSLGMLARARWERRHAAAVTDDAVARSSRLDAAVARAEERERIAREVHDAIGHRLSVISLHAGALEASVPPGTPAAQSAQAVREAAAAAVDDLHSLLRMLREPGELDSPSLPLTRLREVLDAAALAGQPMSSSVFIADADSASPALSRAVFRIVQEILTNASRHAPGTPLSLQVTGSPADGVTIDASNPLPAPVDAGSPPWPTTPHPVTTGMAPAAGERGGTQPTAPVTPAAQAPSGGGHGLEGIRERVTLLGGTLEAGPDPAGIRFALHVTLPWS